MFSGREKFLRVKHLIDLGEFLREKCLVSFRNFKTGEIFREISGCAFIIFFKPLPNGSFSMEIIPGRILLTDGLCLMLKF